jgi:RNase P subunit RPR2
MCEKTRGEKMKKNEQEKSQEMFDEVITGMKEWRACHPKATMREIELEARQRVSRLEAHLIEESALEGQAKEWAGKQPEERPTCANCGEPLVARGKQKRRMQATMGREVELERTYGTCPKCGAGFFPLG